MKKNAFCCAAMAATVLFLSIAAFPSQAAETGPGFEEAVEDTYDGPESPLETAGISAREQEAEFKVVKLSPIVSEPISNVNGKTDISLETLSPSEMKTDPEETFVPGNSYGVFKISAYCDCEKCCGDYVYTYSGTVPKENHTISADLNQFPLGTKLCINGIVYTVEDKGSSVTKNRLDIYFDTHEEALDYGLQKAEVFEAVATAG